MDGYFKDAIGFALDIDTRQILDIEINKNDRIFSFEFNPNAKYQDPNESYEIDYSFSELAEFFERAIARDNYILSLDINSSGYSATLYEDNIISMSFNYENKLDCYLNLCIWMFDKSWCGEEYFSLNGTFIV